MFGKEGNHTLICEREGLLCIGIGSLGNETILI